MNIHFYLDNEVETPITTMYDLHSNPFKIDDEISLDVYEVYPSDYRNFKEDYKINLLKENKELEANFKRKKIKIVREGKYLNFNIIKEPNLTIEYHCVYSEA